MAQAAKAGMGAGTGADGVGDIAVQVGDDPLPVQGGVDGQQDDGGVSGEAGP